jgi:RNase H-fold protein (predicted Holliday junction resolvase)
MTLLGIDHGTRRSGIAVEIAGIALPQLIIPTPDLISTIHALMREYPITGIIVGRAPHLNSNKKSKQEHIQDAFCAELRREFSELEIISYPEWFSTKQARFELERAGLDSEDNVDDQAAAIILQDYIDSH